MRVARRRKSNLCDVGSDVTDRLRLELYKQSRPQQVPSSGISPVGSSGTVPTFLLQTTAIRNSSLSARVSDYAFHLLWA
jgi:hypothetical protein